MKLTNLKIKDLLASEARLTFLVGAGCSIDPPSCLPAGKSMMDVIIKYACPESEIDTIRNLEELRFEALVEIFRDKLDNDLKIIDYYGLCDKPNTQHFFLADMIKRGHFIVTTNFDFLIESALLQSGVPNEDIKVIITKEDFEKFNNPQDLFSKGFKALYKIHGATKNIITDEETKDTLIATIQAFGSNKEGLNVFQVEPFKKPLIDNITKNRSLVIIGYSGSDDFDIVPTLKVLENVKNFIWINHTKNDNGTEKIYEIEESDSQSKINQILSEVRRMYNAEHSYRIDVNTSRIMGEMIEKSSKLSLERFTITPEEWLQQNFPEPSKIVKYSIAFRIYSDFGLYNDALKCNKEIFSMAERSSNPFWKALSRLNFGQVFFAKGEYSDALEWCKQVLEYPGQFDTLWVVVNALKKMGEIYYELANYPEAFKIYNQILDIHIKLNNLEGKAVDYYNMGRILYRIGNYPEALSLYDNALKIAKQFGNLTFRATILNNIGLVYLNQSAYNKALKYFSEALNISTQLGDWNFKIKTLVNIGFIHYNQGSYSDSLKCCEEAVVISEKLRLLPGKAAGFNLMGLIFLEKKDDLEALKNFEKALKIDEQLGDLSGKVSRLNNIATIYINQKNYPEALRRLEEVKQIAEELKESKVIAVCLSNIGSVYALQGELLNALKKFLNAQGIYEKLANLELQVENLNKTVGVLGELADKDPTKHLPSLASALFNLGVLCFGIGEIEGAEESNYKALQLYYKLAEKNPDKYLPKAALNLNNLGMSYRKLGKFNDAEGAYRDSLELYIKLKEKNHDFYLPKIANTSSNLGQIYIDLHRYEDAEKIYKNSLEMWRELTKKNSKYLQNVVGNLNDLGLIYKNLKKYGKSEEAYLNGLNILNENFDIHIKKSMLMNNLGNLHLITRKLDKAENIFNEILEIGADINDESQAWYFKACIESLKNNKLNSLRYLRKSIDLISGWVNNARIDEYFANMRDSKEFKELIGD